MLSNARLDQINPFQFHGGHGGKARSAGPEDKCQHISGLRTKMPKLADLQKTCPGVKSVHVTAEQTFEVSRNRMGDGGTAGEAALSLCYRKFWRVFSFNKPVAQCVIFIFVSQV